jgi:hypothetical protein
MNEAELIRSPEAIGLSLADICPDGDALPIFGKEEIVFWMVRFAGKLTVEQRDTLRQMLPFGPRLDAMIEKLRNPRRRKLP